MFRVARGAHGKHRSRPLDHPHGHPVSTSSTDLEHLAAQEYAYGFSTDLDTELAPKGLSEDVIRLISVKKDEPGWLLDWRLRAYRAWRTMSEPAWQNVRYEPIDYDDIIYYA